jgi:hypothetical protein
MVFPDVASLVRAMDFWCSFDRNHKFRHCERSEAIQSFSAEAVWIASLRSQ